MSLNTNLRNLLFTLILISVLFLFLFGKSDWLIYAGVSFEGELKSVFIIFIGILMEAIPFLLLGVIVSSVIHEFISEDSLKKWIPSHPVSALFSGIIVAAVTPVCECAIIPVVRRLIQKGVPIHAGIAILTAAPILNFIVFGSTFYAFQGKPSIYIGRMLLCIITAMITASIIYVFFSGQNILRNQSSDFTALEHHKHKHSKIKRIMNHCVDEFFLVSKYFMFGVLLASAAQVYLDRSTIAESGSDPVLGTAFMMGLAFILSLCSEADAFVAAAFQHSVPEQSILAFLVFGPMLDLKNTLVMLSSFRIKFVLFFILIVSVIVFLLSMLSGIVLREGLV